MGFPWPVPSDTSTIPKSYSWDFMMYRLKRTSHVSLPIAVVFLVSALASPGEIPEDRGAMGLSQALLRLDVIGSVLHTGAHPDDENSALLAWLARGGGVRTAYLSATRGEGGVNLVGSELFEALGVIRTEELFGARRLDHAEQFFTPNYEFGFSKSAQDTFTKWPHDQVLGDFVRVIRYFRPEIIISRFTGTPRDGHGHHQVAGIITQEAFKAAADPGLFPEYGRPWQAKKLYLNVTGNEQNPPAGLVINVGEYDPALGRSYSQIASEGRSLHRSQAQGGAQESGPRQTRLQLVQKTVAVADNAPLFEGSLYKLPDLAQLDPTIAGDVAELERRVTSIRAKVNLIRPFDISPDLAAALRLLQQTKTKSPNEHVRFLLQRKESDFQEALRLATGLVADVLASDDTVAPGQEFNLTISVTNGGPHHVSNLRLHTNLPPGWTQTSDGSSGSLEPGQRFDQKYKITVSGSPDFTQPYWLRQPRQGDRFVWPPATAGMLPIDETLLPTDIELDYEGATIVMDKPAEFRRVDRMLGEQRTLLKSVPAVSVGLSPEIAIVPLKGKRRKEFTVNLENESPAGTRGEVSLILPSGWTALPESQSVNLSQQGEKASLRFLVSIPGVEGDYSIDAVLRSGNQEFKTGYAAIAYPHIETRHVFSRAQAKVEVLDVATTVSSVGYIDGTGDGIPEALRQLGVNVTMLSPSDIATADLAKYPTIVVGVRAYAVRDDLRAYSRRLMEYVSNGGTLLVQYNRANEVGGVQIAPYPLTIPNTNQNNQERVTHEDAPVRILDPKSPVLNLPNKITESDFEDWVDERGTFFSRSWDSHYVTPLDTADPGEPGRAGGLVIAKYGKGTYIYTGYSFFRQLPAGVKGAYRLFANLVSTEN